MLHVVYVEIQVEISVLKMHVMWERDIQLLHIYVSFLNISSRWM